MNTPLATAGLASPGADLTIAQAAATRERLLQHLAAARGDLTLDVSGVADCDSSGVQLLLATSASLCERGHRLALQDPSPALTDALATFGLIGWLQDHQPRD